MRSKNVLVVCLLVSACGQSPSTPKNPRIVIPTPAPTVTPTPVPAPSGHILIPYDPTPTQTPSPLGSLGPRPTVKTRPGSFTYDFRTTAVDLIDVRNDGYNYPWLMPGNWSIEDGRLMHRDIRQQPALSFRRYSGTTFGPNGALPDRYQAQVTLVFDSSFEAPNSYPPTGDQGTPFYYIDPTHYVEVLIKPNLFEVWECNGGQPEKNGGWKRLYAEDLVTAKGDRRTLGVNVDSASGQMEVFLDGARRARVSSPLIDTRVHYLALRAAGNVVGYENLSISSP